MRAMAVKLAASSVTCCWINCCRDISTKRNSPSFASNWAGFWKRFTMQRARVAFSKHSHASKSEYLFRSIRGQKILISFLCRVNFPLLYRAIFAAVIDALNRKLDKSNQNLGQLKVWESSCAIINQMLDLAKLIDLSRVFTVFLKVYNRHCIPHQRRSIELSILLERIEYAHIPEDVSPSRHTNDRNCHETECRSCVGIPEKSTKFHKIFAYIVLPLEGTSIKMNSFAFGIH